MKKKLLMFILSLFLFIPSVKAVSASIGVSSSGKAVVGNTITVTVTLSSGQALGSWDMLLSYDNSHLQLTSSSAEGGGTKMVGYVSNSSTKSKSYTFKFKALKSGNATVSVGNYSVYAFDESVMSVSGGSKTISIITQEELEASYSKDNNLKSITVDSYELSPAFNKDTTEYTVTVPADVTKVNVSAEKNDSAATMTGTGEVDLSEGSNTVEIVVTAQNGTTKTYKVTINVEDLNPIEVTVGNQKLSIVKRAGNLTIPNGYQLTTIKINDVDVPALVNESNNFTLVGLKDETGNINLYKYDNEKNTYVKYIELNFDGVNLYPLSIGTILDNYKKSTVKINEQEIECLKLSNDSKFVLIYGTNLLTGKDDYYSYDIKNHTLQLYNTEYIDKLNNDIEYNYYIMIALGVLCAMFFLLLVLMVSLNKKQKKMLAVKNRQSKKKEEVVEKTKKEKNKIGKDFLE
ncbi:MAG: cadherin-like beta sandwich domain-containing protein [Bacilli bacterium]|nr:cadherin-like beta sandwich domain-containing protein [Bacilli bacterium]